MSFCNCKHTNWEKNTAVLSVVEKALAYQEKAPNNKHHPPFNFSALSYISKKLIFRYEGFHDKLIKSQITEWFCLLCINLEDNSQWQWYLCYTLLCSDPMQVCKCTHWYCEQKSLCVQASFPANPAYSVCLFLIKGMKQASFSWLYFKKVLQQVVQLNCGFSLLRCRSNRDWELCGTLCVLWPFATGTSGFPSVSVWKPKLEKGKQQTWFKTTRRDHCRMLGNTGLQHRCWHEGGISSCFSSLLKRVTRQGVGMAACQWNIMVYGLGRVVGYYAMERKEGRAIEDRVKDEGNVTGAGEGEIRYIFIFFCQRSGFFNLFFN